MKQKQRLTSLKAIKLHCCECYGWDGYQGGNVGTPYETARGMVRECDSPKCALYPFRNGRDGTAQKREFSEEERNVIRARFKKNVLARKIKGADDPKTV